MEARRLPLSASRPSRALLGSGLFIGVATFAANGLNALFQIALARVLSPAEYSVLVALVVITLIAAVPPLAFQASVARITQEWTTDRAAVSRAVERVESVGGTAIYDAVAQALPVAATGRHRKKAILVISDGSQQSGRTSAAAAALRARSAHIPVYSVLIGTQDGVITVTLAGGFQAQIRVPPSPETLRTALIKEAGSNRSRPAESSSPSGTSTTR